MWFLIILVFLKGLESLKIRDIHKQAYLIPKIVNKLKPFSLDNDGKQNGEKLLLEIACGRGVEEVGLGEGEVKGVCGVVKID